MHDEMDEVYDDMDKVHEAYKVEEVHEEHERKGETSSPSSPHSQIGDLTTLEWSQDQNAPGTDHKSVNPQFPSRASPPSMQQVYRSIRRGLSIFPWISLPGSRSSSLVSFSFFRSVFYLVCLIHYADFLPILAIRSCSCLNPIQSNPP